MKTNKVELKLKLWKFSEYLFKNGLQKLEYYNIFDPRILTFKCICYPKSSKRVSPLS